MRIIGYVVGCYMLFNALMTAVIPNRWADFTTRPIENILPPEQAAAVHEFTVLSPGAMRFWAALEAGFGLFVLGLASRRSGTTHR